MVAGKIQVQDQRREAVVLSFALPRQGLMVPRYRLVSITQFHCREQLYPLPRYCLHSICLIP